MMIDPLVPARRLALLVPTLLIAGALGSQYLGGLYPCEMCHWQRWPHYAAILLAGLAFLPASRPGRMALIVIAALAIGLSGLIGAFHAGVEYGWWDGLTQCSLVDTAAQDTSAAIWATPLIRCDEVQWSFLGISLAGYNALFSLGGAAAILWLCLKPARR